MKARRKGGSAAGMGAVEGSTAAGKAVTVGMGAARRKDSVAAGVGAAVPWEWARHGAAAGPRRAHAHVGPGLRPAHARGTATLPARRQPQDPRRPPPFHLVVPMAKTAAVPPSTAPTLWWASLPL